MNGDGTVDLAHSKNITGANVVAHQGSTYCFRGLAFAFGSIAATADLADPAARAPRPRSGPWATATRWPGPRPPCRSNGHAFYVVFN